METSFSSSAKFTKDSLRKQFRWSEFLAEKVISGVAFLSIAIIFLIFIFVFKESLPLFSSNKKVEKTEVKATTTTQPETYGGATEDLAPETYGAPLEDLSPTEAASTDLQPETYGANPSKS